MERKDSSKLKYLKNKWQELAELIGIEELFIVC